MAATVYTDPITTNTLKNLDRKFCFALQIGNALLQENVANLILALDELHKLIEKVQKLEQGFA